MSSRILRTIDAHAAGEPLRVVVEGWPVPEGQTVGERLTFARKHQDDLRRILMLEPRGHADMCGAILTPPDRPDSDAGLLFMHNAGFGAMSGHGIIGATTVACERGLIRHADGRSRLAFDVPAGQILVQAAFEHRGGRHRVAEVSVTNVPSFVLVAGLPVRVGGRDLRVDVAFGGAFFAIVDAESAGLAVVPSRLPELRRLGMSIAREVDRQLPVVHPQDPALGGISGTVFTGPASTDAHLRNVTIFADHAADRSPCGTATCAVLAVLDAMGLTDVSVPFVHESILGTRFRARVVSLTTVGDLPAIVPELSGAASITGEHTFIVEDDDPLGEGFLLEAVQRS